MSTVAAQPFSGTYHANPVVSTVAFAVRHAGVYRYRGSLSDVTATLCADGAAVTLEGSARVDSISIVEPPEMRASVLGVEFFDVDHHPEVTFRSTELRLHGDGRAELEGLLTIRGISLPVTATGRYEPPRPSTFSDAVAGLRLHTILDRRNFGFDWQAELPGGGDVLGWDVELDIELLLQQDDESARG
jgi:polyisoprenoid-binding protein YceI